MASLDQAPTETTPLRTKGTPREAAWLNYGAATFAYLAASVFTRPVFLSDTTYYLSTANPRAAEFWDFGHLLWRPLLWILMRQFNVADRAAKFLLAFHILDVASTLAGLAALWFIVATIRLFTRNVAATLGTAIMFSFSQVVLTYSKGGCAYVFGLLALSAGSYVLLHGANRQRPVWHDPVLCGVLLALSVCLWLPYVLAIPGILVSPIVFSESGRRPWRLVVAAAALSGVVTAISYGAVAIHLGIADLRGFASWEAASSHAITISGAKRAVFGFARSFVALGENGSTFKRFLLHDPYNPVSFWRVFGLTLWKIILFYIFLASLLATAVRTRHGRSAIWALVVTSLPVLAFAVSWQGADLERYLPLFPSLVLVVALALDRLRVRSVWAVVVSAFVVTLAVSNLFAISARSRERQFREITDTMRSLNASLPANSLVLLPPMHPLQRIYWDFPEALPLAEHNLKLERIVDLGTADTPRWRTLVSADIEQRLNKQIPVVIDSSLLQTKPQQDSSWVEGDDPRVHWRDIHDFVSSLQIGSRVGGTEFFIISATAHNIDSIEKIR